MHWWKTAAGISTPWPADVARDVDVWLSGTLVDSIGLDIGVSDGTVVDEASLLDTWPLDGVSL